MAKEFTPDQLKEEYKYFYRKSKLIMYAFKDEQPFTDDTIVDIITCGDKFSNPIGQLFPASELDEIK